jgi:outer membrane protein
MMRTHTFTAVVTALALAATASPASAQQAKETPTELHVQQLIKEAVARLDASQPPAAGAAQGQAQSEPAPPTVPLTLDDAIKLALDRNLDIAVQRLNPQLSDIAVASAQAAYSPSVTSVLGKQSSVRTPTSQLQLSSGGGGVTSKTLTYNAGLTKNLSWLGASASATLNNSRTASNSNNVLFNPQFQSNWTFQYNQPLLRNLHIDSTRQTIAVSKINRDISDVQLQATITNTVSNVRDAYWDYVYATQAVQVAQQSVDLANKLVQDNQTRVQVGTMAPIDVVTAQSQAATAQQALVAAQSTERTDEIALKRLIVSGTEDPNWNAHLDPVDRPDFQAVSVDIADAVRKALSQRTDLMIAKKEVDANSITMNYLQDQTRPDVTLSANYTTQGVGGPYLQRSQSGVLGSTVEQTIPGGLGDALSSLFQNQYPGWNMQVNVTYPLGYNTTDASVARARVQLNQVQAQLKQVELQVATDVTNAAIQVRNNAEVVQAAQAAVKLAQQTLDAEQSKFDVGMSTNYLVIQAQRDLANAQNSELGAVRNYRKALVELERLEQTTLSSSGITILGR